ncbi:hypothetical protein JYT26_00085 [Beggiatoa alba]|nr:hypothetical protein [Beggiatoa alba]
MKLFFAFATLLYITVLTGCSSPNILTEQEIKTQNDADSVVAELLFEKELNVTTSYNVRKNGFVVIRFDKSVPKKIYTEVVHRLRENTKVSGVFAEQEGTEVCRLP